MTYFRIFLIELKCLRDSFILQYASNIFGQNIQNMFQTPLINEVFNSNLIVLLIMF